MTRHLLRLIWNRKRHNLLLSIEIFFSFVVLLAVTVLLINVAVNYGQPLGYRTTVASMVRSVGGAPNAH